jgi:hypothetical protein
VVVSGQTIPSDLEDRMLRRALVIAAAAISALLLPATANAATPDATPNSSLAAGSAVRVQQASAPPVFANYLVCFNGWVYTDFTDPDGNDANLHVLIAVFRPNYGGWTTFNMVNTGPSTHGVFFYQQLSAIGVDPATVTQYAFTAYDETNSWAVDWTYADANCKVVRTP